MADIKVSVIMPCLDSAAYIGKAIESVLRQTLSELELIIVDAGSTDGTVEIIEKYRKTDDRIVLLVSEKKSMGYQYNKGIWHAKGEYVGFVETDDLIHSEMYEKLYNVAKKNRIDLVKSDFDLFMGDGKERIILNYSILTAYHKNLYHTVINPENHPWILYRDMNMWNGIYNREFLLQSQIALNETPGAAFQDMGFVFQTFIRAQRVMYVPYDSYYYRRDNENASQYNWIRHMQFITNELGYVWTYMKERNIAAPFRQFIFYRCFRQFVQIYGYYLCEADLFEKRIDSKRYIDVLQTCYKTMDYPEVRDEELDESVLVNMLQEGKERFDAAVQCSYLSKKFREKAFNEFIENHKFVIVGLGEQGKALLALCHRLHIEDNVMGLCDNDEKKSGAVLFGRECKTLEEYGKQNLGLKNKVYYIIANVTCYEEIREQLVDMGIRREKIVHCIDGIQTHSVLEIEIVKENG